MSASAGGIRCPTAPSCHPNTPDPHAFRESSPLPHPPVRPVAAGGTADPERAATRATAGAGWHLPVRGRDGTGAAQFALGAAEMGAAQAALAANRSFRRPDDAAAKRDATA